MESSSRGEGVRRIRMRNMLLLICSGVLVGIVLMVSFGAALALTNTTEFCISCHEMRDTVYREYTESMHFRNPSGVRVGCADCHVPKALGPKLRMKVMAVKDIYHTLLGTVDTPEKFEAHRWEMASRVWRRLEQTDSATCRGCHQWDAMALSEQDRIARRKHKRAEAEGGTCIDCHKGIAHEQPDAPEALALGG